MINNNNNNKLINAVNCGMLNLFYNTIISYILVSDVMCDTHTIRVTTCKYSFLMLHFS